MYGVYTYIYHKNQPNVGIYTIHGSNGYLKLLVTIGINPSGTGGFFRNELGQEGGTKIDRFLTDVPRLTTGLGGEFPPKKHMFTRYHGTQQPSFLRVISYNPYIGGLKRLIFI